MTAALANTSSVQYRAGQKLGAIKHRFFSIPIRTRITIESIVLAVTVLLAVVWIATPYLARYLVNQKLSKLPDYVGRVEWLQVNPWTASVDVYQVHMDKRGGEIPVHFVYVPLVHVALQWSQIIHGVFRSSITIFNPRINFVAGPSKAQSQFSISKVWIDTVRKIIPFRVNQARILDGDVHLLDFHATPQVDMEIQHLEVRADNLSNSEKEKTPLPGRIKITARPLITGYFEMNLSMNLDEKYATFSQNFRMEHVPAVAANSALKKYAKVELKSGEIGLYSELTGDKGVYKGYVKPFFYNLVFQPKPSDQGTPGELWAGFLNAVKGIFENDQHTIATEGTISGRVDQPNVDPFGVLTGVIWNAYIQALSTGFDPTHSPAKPTDTVTTPQSTQTQQEADAHTSPAAK